MNNNTGLPDLGFYGAQVFLEVVQSGDFTAKGIAKAMAKVAKRAATTRR